MMSVTTEEERLSHEQRIARQAEILVGALGTRPGATPVLLHITGGQTAGKSALLRELGAQLQGIEKKPIVVSPPAHELDVGPIALLQLGAGLERHGIIDGQFGVLTSQELTWPRKLEAVRGWLGECACRGDVILLLDEPQFWPSRSGEDYHFGKPAEDVAHLLLGQIDVPRVVAGRMPDYLVAARSHRANLSGDRTQWLGDSDEWGALASAASEIAELGQAIGGRTPLEIRLLVAIQALGEGGRLRRLIARPTSRLQISVELCNVLSARPDLEAARKMWAKVAMVRGALGSALLTRLGLDGLAEHQRDLVRCCLLYREGEQLFMHETLRRDALQCNWLQDPERQDTQRRLAEYYRSQFQQADSDLVAEAEAFHHATETGDREFANGFRAFFVEQLDAFGKMLSAQKREYAQAAAVYERSIQWDPDNDYAHHYLAYNLDIEGREAPCVEAHYKKALEIESTNAYWNSRWITYLITRGRLPDSRRAWDEAMDALGLPDEDRDSWVYEHVHIWVARLLIHRGQLDFARDVLGSIPTGVRGRHLGMKALVRRLEALLEARRTGAVFPLSVAPKDWWSRGPHLAAPLSDAGQPLRNWRPGRVESIDQGGIHLLVADPPAEAGGEPTHGKLTIDRGDFDRFSRDIRTNELEAGQFIEIVTYQGRVEPIIRVHQARSFRDDDLPPLFPNPARYLMADGWVA